MRSSPIRSLIAAAWLLACGHGVALAQAAPAAAPPSPAAAATLRQQGRYWQDRQPDRAAEAWKKLLAVDPGNAEALLRLGRLSLDARKPDEARRYLDLLRAAHPGSPELLELQQDVDVATPASQAELDQARILVREKRLEEAVQKYRALFKGREPRGRMAVEYYSVLGYTPAGRDEALAELRRMQRLYPGDSQIALTIASLRLQSPGSRLDAMRALAALSKRQDIGGEATEQWRGALGWLGSPPPAAYAGLFREYLAANPDDTDIREQFAGRGRKLPGRGAIAARNARAGDAPAADAPKRLAPEALHTADGNAEIQNGNYDKADAEFSAALAINPRFADAVGGMALLRFRQKRFAESRRHAEEAFRLDGQEGWKILQDTVTYWELLEQAAAAREARRYGEAERILQQARAITLEEEDTNAENRLAGVYADQKQFSEAERIYRSVLARVPDDQLAMNGLVAVLSATDRGDEALALIENLTEEQRASLDVDRLRAEQAIGAGRLAMKRGQDAAAREQFRKAVALQPDNPWMRLELARLDLRTGARADARQRMESLLERHPGEPDVIYTTALLRGNLRDWPGVVQLLERVPPGQRTAAMASLQRSAVVHVQTDQALALAGDARRRADAPALLSQLGTRVGDDPDLLGIIAQGYVDLGEPERARTLLRSAIERSARVPARAAATIGLQLRYAEVLLAAGDDRNLADVLRQLQARSQAGQLDSDDRESLETLRRAYVVRQAEALRKLGRLAEGYELLHPLLVETPQDPVPLGLLARMYNDAGQPQKARAIYRDVLARAPDDVGSLTAAAGLAIQQRDFRGAEQYIARAETLAPRHPDVLASRGRLLRAQGKPGQAVAYLSRAAEAVKARDPALSASPDASGHGLPADSFPADNPFAAPARSPRSLATPESAGSGSTPERLTR
ncbi:tetratricopeptide repeat protein [Xylophilus sp.]|uniref:tetratricopeptide repeat protein n=1 Tax=Xylophilus sp. TaxID=2653893 RepID=UPI0013B814F0|nr:tetratricopeptide repeat protein [Xylophilus sp.]KAF1050044.1 MAG: Cellulose synthase operon protein C [Xylophilus sp.]